MSSNVSITAPFVPRFYHSDATMTGSYSEVLARSAVPEKRVNLVLQNQDSTLAIYVRLAGSADTNTGGLLIAAGATLSLDSYKGAVQAMAPSGSPILHIAYATV